MYGGPEGEDKVNYFELKKIILMPCNYIFALNIILYMAFLSKVLTRYFLYQNARKIKNPIETQHSIPAYAIYYYIKGKDLIAVTVFQLDN